jgi:predicted esterase
MRRDRDILNRGFLTARPSKKAPAVDVLSGLQPLQLDKKRDGLIYIPEGYDPGKPSSLAVMLHGAGGNAEHGISLLLPIADAANIILLAPFSRNSTWDIIFLNQYGQDILFIDEALNIVFDRYLINPKQVAIGGFSDGASYALSVGLANGDLFTHILAFSPGFAYAPEMQGNPGVFISHGTKDHILPIDPCSRKISPRLQKKGYDLTYREFDGEHVLPADIRDDAVRWFTGRQF